MASPAPPPPPTPDLPKDSVASLLSLARSLALVVALVSGLLFLILLALSILSLFVHLQFGGIAGAIYCLVSAVVNYAAWREIPGLEQMAARQQYTALKDHLLVWVILGVLFFVIVGVVLLVAWLRVEGTGAPMAAPPPPPSPTGVPSAPPPCPTCRNPTTWIPEYSRFYCYRCSKYV